MADGTQARERKSQVLAQQLRDRIASGEWPPGHRLPSERVLVAEYGVSRPAVREALQVLQLAGDVETRLGEGSFVLEPRPEDAASAAGLAAGTSITEMMEVREAVEVAAAALAVRHATRSDGFRLQAVVAELEDALEAEDYEEYLRATLRLHKQVAAASHNRYLTQLVEEITDRHGRDQWLLQLRYNPEVAAFSLDVHRAIVQGILDRDLQAAVAATVDHYEDYPALRSSEAT
jgi:DNA-binding FadR family transcriptional regulator